MQLHPGMCREDSGDLRRMLHRINERSLRLLNGLIEFKEKILCEVSAGNLFTFNYPLLIKHILREAKLYRSIIDNLMHNRQISCRELLGTEDFWNRIMMEQSLFIRGRLDPCEEKLIETADNFAADYKRLLERAKKCDCMATEALTGESLDETLKYRDFKAASTKDFFRFIKRYGQRHTFFKDGRSHYTTGSM